MVTEAEVETVQKEIRRINKTAAIRRTHEFVSWAKELVLDALVGKPQLLGKPMGYELNPVEGLKGRPKDKEESVLFLLRNIHVCENPEPPVRRFYPMPGLSIGSPPNGLSYKTSRLQYQPLDQSHHSRSAMSSSP